MKKVTRKLKFFLDVLVKSLTKFPYYKEVKKANFKFSLKYLFFLFYIISLITSIVFAASISILILPKVPAFVASFENKAKSLYPEGLVVNVKNGVVTTNTKEPYFVDSLNTLGLNKGYDHFLTIDTKATASDIKNDSTVILVTKDSVATIDSNSTYKIYQIDPTSNLTIDKASYLKVVSQISPYLKYIMPGLIALVVLLILVWPILGAALALIAEFVYLLLFALIFFVVVKVMKKDLSYKKTLQLSMHAATLPILLGFVVGSLGIQMPFLLGTAILFIFMILVVREF